MDSFSFFDVRDELTLRDDAILCHCSRYAEDYDTLEFVVGFNGMLDTFSEILWRRKSLRSSNSLRGIRT